MDKPETADIVSTLPPELLAHIFWFLSDECPDICSCRLVCRAFKDYSSPYLITKIVFASRLKEITRFQEILAHPYYRRYVTELVYDASYFDTRLGHDWDRYVDACSNGPRDLRGHEWEERSRQDQACLNEIQERAGLTGSVSSQQQRPPMRSVSGSYVYGLRSYLLSYRTTCCAKLSRLLRLLRSVTFTDWRGLAKQGESYDECARRLFGNVLNPLCMSLKERHTCTMSLINILGAINDSPQACIESIRIGRHPFEHKPEFLEGLEFAEDPHPMDEPRQTICVDALLLGNPPGPLNAGEYTTNLRRLDLQLRIDEECLASSTEYPLGAPFLNASNLTYLRLHLEMPSMMNWPQEARTFLLDGGRRMMFFRRLLTDLALPKLRTVHLQHLPLFQSFLQKFLEKHAATLREVRLVDCVIYTDGYSLAKWASRSLRLDGVVLQGSCGAPFPPAEEYLALETQEHIWLGGRQNFAAPEWRTEVVGYSDDGEAQDHHVKYSPWWAEKRIWK